MQNIRIAWLLNTAFFYWQPPLSEFTKLFPKTKVFTAWWRGYAPGYEKLFPVEVVGDRKIISLKPNSTSYGLNFTALPLHIVRYLFHFKPNLIFSNSFGVWTVLAILLQDIGNWRVVIAYEGSSPVVDYRNSPLRLAVRRWMVKQAKACITNSQAGQRYLTDILDADTEEVFVQPYEVPHPNSLLQNTPSLVDFTELSRPIFLFVGSIEPRKGLNFLLEACAKLNEQGDRNYTLLVVGDGEERPKLETYCQDNQLTEQVKWLGKVPYGELGHFFRNADIFILPTLEDTWGVVVSEAMIFGTGVLCSQYAGAVELIDEGENGYSFDPRNPDTLSELMRRCIHDPSLGSQLGTKSQETMTKYTPETAAQFLAKVTHFALDLS
ncbi:glycosyltransferase family 4 protein [Spirulina sp. CS-785/01]|uniref:glycosyltransferase family 4 protein n=1 Tax=Spirulina sp. CS-785/01 TaxID=3021716 RepID=UPI00232D5E37|nr:glycosyltransferase family 4 protein [Spirulina sp. CS-785/01]MDB9315912.1 glycosyltransferase family 4 protein [Spirulina sp. CS-785/01]